jgi:protein SCO1/2
MKSSKILILVLTLTFPVIIYLFLTFYGSNEFDLPVYFETKNELCDGFKPIGQVEDQLISQKQIVYQLRDILRDNINIVHFPDLEKDNQQLVNELGRLLLTFSTEENVTVHALYKKKVIAGSDFLMDNGNVANYELGTTFYDKLVDCYIALPTKKWADDHPAEMVVEASRSLVLIDRNGRIRGYYDGEETKDIDRLILEIRILMTKYSEK